MPDQLMDWVGIPYGISMRELGRRTLKMYDFNFTMFLTISSINLRYVVPSYFYLGRVRYVSKCQKI